MFFKLYFETVFLRLNCLTRQLFIGRVMQIGRSPCACRAVPDSSGQAGLAQCAAWASGRPTVPIVMCGFAVWFLSGVPRVLLFACLPHSPSREGAGWFLGGPSLGHPGQSPLRRVLRPAHRHPCPQRR